MRNKKLSDRLKAFNHCPECKCKLTNGNSIVLNGGSMAKIGNNKYKGDESLLPFLTLIWHEYSPQKKTKKIKESSVLLEVTDKSNHLLGQFEYNFCSIECIRNWFNGKLDELVLAAKDRGLTRLKTKKEMVNHREKKKAIFTKAEVEDKRLALIRDNLGISPISVDQEGYIYDGKEVLDKLIEKLQRQESGKKKTRIK